MRGWWGEGGGELEGAGEERMKGGRDELQVGWQASLGFKQGVAGRLEGRGGGGGKGVRGQDC